MAIQTTTVRFAVGANQDTTFRNLAYDYRTVPTTNFLGTTCSLATSQYNTILNLGTLTSSINLTVSTASFVVPEIGDQLDVLAIGAAAATYSVVFDSAIFAVQTSTTCSVGYSQNMKYSFKFNGSYFVGSGFAV
jgi:outer membrane receptor for Fe3+-dicitrate